MRFFDRHCTFSTDSTRQQHISDIMLKILILPPNFPQNESFSTPDFGIFGQEFFQQVIFSTIFVTALTLGELPNLPHRGPQLHWSKCCFLVSIADWLTVLLAAPINGRVSDIKRRRRPEPHHRALIKFHDN